MKKVHFLTAALLALAMTACNDDPIADKNALGPAGTTEGQFIGISIANAANYGSRADESVKDQQYVTGTADENHIDKDQLHFLFFDRLGNPFIMQVDNKYADGVIVNEETNWIKPVNIIDDNKPNQNVGNVQTGGNDDKTNAVLLLGKAPDAYQGVIPSRIICIANVDDDFVKTHYANKSIAQLMQELSDGEDAPIHKELRNANGDFLMTSSTYFDGTTVRCWSDINPSNFSTNPQTALNNPVQIYIERLAAKVYIQSMPEGEDNIVKGNDGNVLEFTYHKLEGTGADEKVVVSDPVNVIVEPTGWITRSNAKQNFGIKHLMNGNSTSSYFASAAHFNQGVRSFWASTSSYHDIELFTPATDLNQKNFKDEKNKPMVKYLFANTNDPFLEGEEGDGVDSYRGEVNFARSFATKILIGVNLYTVPAGEKTVAEDNTPAQLMLWAGNYYTPDALCKVLEDSKLTAAEKAEGWVICYGRAQTRTQNVGHCNVRFFKSKTKAHSRKDVTDNTGKVPATNQNSFVPFETKDNVPAALYWNGMGYYILNIDNNLKCTKVGHDFEGKPMYGVVRNTVYAYDIVYFVGLGTPITNPNIPTEPENPAESDGYVAAKLNVLDWRVITNLTTLQ
ncbi:MAG: Mfa1 fimbrilin C-terminal domain-containing protein [Muribaculaceae bacterium]|nr:Mfa1 fimbrilin C-terminal domain-containing protein [Muribaculaceae bacterium]